MKTSGKLDWECLEKKNLKRIGIKFNPKMVELIEGRIQQAKKAGRGLNILIEGDVKRGYGIVNSNQGKEYSHTLYADGVITIKDWNPDIAYTGKHHFWLEGFEEME